MRKYVHPADEAALQEAHERLGALIGTLAEGDDDIYKECERARELISNVLAAACDD